MQKLGKGESCGRNELSDAGVKEFPGTEWISRDETVEREVCVYRVKRRNLAENASRRNLNKFSTTIIRSTNYPIIGDSSLYYYYFTRSMRDPDLI